ncbi:hypothetical protein ACIQXF_11195 [Lysinibacillus sp. NPDC097231]
MNKLTYATFDEIIEQVNFSPLQPNEKQIPQKFIVNQHMNMAFFM